MKFRDYLALVEGAKVLDEKKGRPDLGSAWVVIEDPETGMVLLGKRAKSANNSGQWNLFGGGIEGTETAIETAIRELWEEGGIKVSPQMLAKIPTSPPGMTIYGLTMTAKQVKKSLRLSPAEVSKARWFDMSKLPADLHKSAVGLLKASSALAKQEKDDARQAQGVPTMRNVMDMNEEAIAERIETITGGSGKGCEVLVNPTKREADKAIQRWRTRVRGILDTRNDTIYMCDSWYVYHYQMIKQLGLSEDSAIGFRMADGKVAVYFPADWKEGDPIPNNMKEDLLRLRKSRAMNRIFGANFPITSTEPD
jgi:8-oxo-dGTP pyrophosphatase MutT (NUDIX family)